jgi:protein-S-isoprenylcysteine O-methyltransferase Ste14
MAARANEGSGAVSRFLLRIPVPWVFVLTYLLGAGLERIDYPRPSWLGSSAVGVAGAVLFIVGAALAGWGWLIFQRKGTTRIPGQTSTTLVTWGPYRYMRNPMYTGLTIAYLGEAGLLHQLWPVVLLPLTLAYVNWVVIPLEEKRLREAFGETYESYRSTVRRWL